MKSNGHAAQHQIDPQEAARFALTFLGRVSFTAGERQAFDVAEALLQAIATGNVLLTAGSQPDASPSPDMIAEH